MPRAISLKSGVETLSIKQPYAFTPSQKEVLLASLKAPPEDHEGFFRELEDFASSYTREALQQELTAGGAGVNKALLEIETMARALIAAPAPPRRRLELDGTLSSLNPEAEWPLLLALRRLRPDLDNVAAHRWQSYTAEDIATAAAQARIRRDGARRHPPSSVCVGRIAEAFERYTGRKATHTPYKDLEYRHGPQSEVGRLITAFFSIVDPTVPNTRLSSSLDEFLKARRRRAA